jgi:thiol:disulfide interchange protein DsbD
MEWINQFDVASVNPLFALFLAFAGGVFAGFTPCTYPMIPITIAFVGSKAKGSRWRGFVLSCVYVLGLAIVYSFLGAFAALTGQLFGALTANRWVYFFVGNVCLLAALVMLEVIPLKVPTFLSRVQVSRLGGHDVITCILMGGASALVVGTCTTPILGVLLTLVAGGQNVLLGVSLLFVFAYGMGSLVILVGTFTGLLASLPRSGLWMNRIQKAFAFVMILAAEYFFVKTGEFWL